MMNYLNVDQNGYDSLAWDIFNNYKLLRNGAEYSFCEIEIYLAHVDGYGRPSEPVKDIFCHCAEQQELNFRDADSLYFHYSGCDIPIGSREHSYRGGILIRGIERNGDFLYGPGRVAYDRHNKGKTKLPLSLLKRKIENGGFSMYEPGNGLENLSRRILRLPRARLSFETVRKNIDSDSDNLARYFFLETRYIRLPDSLNFGETRPDEFRSICEALLKKGSSGCRAERC